MKIVWLNVNITNDFHPFFFSIRPMRVETCLVVVVGGGRRRWMIPWTQNVFKWLTPGLFTRQAF